MPDRIDEIRTYRWRDADYDASRFAHVRTMLVPDERRMLHWLSRRSEDVGCIIDAGAFLGGSTVHLADGIQDHPDPLKKVHSFDLFEVSDYALQHYALDGVETTFPQYAANIAPWRDRIVIHPGDVRTSGWHPEPIDILFIDLLKTPDVGDWAAHHFLPQLLPGSVLIQQDFLHPYLPWIHVAMGYFGEHFSYLANTGASVIYACESVVDPSAAREFSYAAIPDDEKRALFDRATGHFRDAEHRRMLGVARDRMTAAAPPSR